MKPDNTTVSSQIIQRLKADNKRFFSNDNISQYLNFGELDQLINELTPKFEDVLRTMIIDVDNDPNSKGTAHRLAKMYVNELFSGRYQPAPKVTAFPNDGAHGISEYKGMLTIRAELKSVCSHHLQPVSGVAYIGIIPTSQVIGLSKYIRIAQHCARRGTLQEQLCNDIAEAIMAATKSENVAVYIQAQHGCCTNRGVMAGSSLTQTTVLHGQFYTEAVKNEFYNNVKMQQSENRFSCA